MISLSDPIWQTLEGGYRSPYDASVPLSELENSDSAEEQDRILDELFEELHHQGYVGLASYLSVSHLIRIGIEKNITGWRLPGLIATIEIERHSDQNPKLPSVYESEYLIALSKVTELTQLNKNWDRTFAVCALAAIAASKGQIDMARVILEFESEDLTDKFNEFLENY